MQFDSSPDGVTGFTTDPALDLSSSYLEYTFRGRAGRIVSVTGIDFGYSRDSGGPRQLVIRSSVDGFTDDLFVDGSISTGTAEYAGPRFAVPLEAEEITFRIFLFDAGNGNDNGVFYLQPFGGGSENALQFKGCIISPLPVELTAFTGTASGEVAELSWVTATERDNDYFSVEHSADGATFAAVGQVDGAGTTGTAQAYGFAYAAQRGGTHYFRLRQVDYDGQFSYSEIVAVDLAGVAALTVANTVAEQELVVSTGAATSYRILGLSGEVAQAGQLGGGREPIDVSALAPGMYVLTDGVTSVRFVR